MSISSISLGRVVYDIDDPRHHGTLEAIIGGWAKIRWIETGWISNDVPAENVRRVRRELLTAG